MSDQKDQKQAEEPKKSWQDDAVKSTAQLDLERRLGNGNAVDYRVQTLSPGEQLERSVGDYLGTDPIYQNYANETEKPYASTEGPEADAEQLHVDQLSLVEGEEGQKVEYDEYAIRQTRAPLIGDPNVGQSGPPQKATRTTRTTK